MNKLLILIFLPLLLSCSREFDYGPVYNVVREKFPGDSFIDKALDRALEEPPLIIYETERSEDKDDL